MPIYQKAKRTPFKTLEFGMLIWTLVMILIAILAIKALYVEDRNTEQVIMDDITEINETSEFDRSILFAVDKPPFHIIYPTDDCSDDRCLVSSSSLHNRLAERYGVDKIFPIFTYGDCYPPAILLTELGDPLSCMVDSDGDVIVVIDPVDRS